MKETQKQGSNRWSGKEGRSSRTPSEASPGNPEKIELWDKPYRWIEARVRRLDAASYMEEIHSMRFFGKNAADFALQIIAIADWGRRYLEVGLSYPVPTFQDFIFTLVPDSHGSQVPVKPSQVRAPAGDVRDKSREAWKWLVVLLQFWGDKASAVDRLVYGGREHPISTLAEYMFNTINPGLRRRFKVTWDDIVIITPWMTKRLHGMTGSQELTVRRQPLPQPGESSELEVTLERMYCVAYAKLKPAGRGKVVTKDTIAPRGKTPTSPLGLPKLGRGAVPKVRLREDNPGDGWSHVTPKDTGPDVGCPKDEKQVRESQEVACPDCSPLTRELLGPGEEVIGDLDYEDIEEGDPGPQPDPEIAQVIAHIPPAGNWADVEIQESHSPPGFEPEVARSGYDVNLVRPNPAKPGSSSPVTAMEDRMLNDPKTPGAGRPGSDENPDRT